MKEKIKQNIMMDMQNNLVEDFELRLDDYFEEIWHEAQKDLMDEKEDSNN